MASLRGPVGPGTLLVEAGGPRDSPPPNSRGHGTESGERPKAGETASSSPADGQRFFMPPPAISTVVVPPSV